MICRLIRDISVVSSEVAKTLLAEGHVEHQSLRSPLHFTETEFINSYTLRCYRVAIKSHLSLVKPFAAMDFVCTLWQL